MAFQCPLCVFVAASLSLILSHLRLVHASDPGFNVTCGITGCVRTFKSFCALYQHIYRKHQDAGIIQQRTVSDMSEPGPSMSLMQDAQTDLCSLDITVNASELGKYSCTHHELFNACVCVFKLQLWLSVLTFCTVAGTMHTGHNSRRRSNGLFLLKMKETSDVSS